MSSPPPHQRDPSGAVQELDESWVDKVVALLLTASARAEALGSFAWTVEDVGRPAMIACARRGELFGWVSDGELLGCVLLQARDDIHWPDDPPGEALYLHKLAVEPAVSGQGIATELIEFACALAVRRGCAMVRLDTIPDTPLVSYYERHGFRADPNGPANYADRWLIRMERPASAKG